MKTYLLAIACTLIIYACSKKENTPTNSTSEEITTDYYTMLSPGNYWVYQQYRIDLTTGEKSIINKTDSLYVGHDTIIDGKEYHQLKGSWFGNKFHRNIRLENNALLDQNGQVYFIQKEKEEVLLRKNLNPSNSAWDSIVWTMNHVSSEIETPYGLFNSEYQYNAKFYINPEFTPDSSHSTRDDTEYYVKEIGVVRYTSFFTAPVNLHMDLIRYHLQQ